MVDAGAVSDICYSTSTYFSVPMVAVGPHLPHVSSYCLPLFIPSFVLIVYAWDAHIHPAKHHS